MPKTKIIATLGPASSTGSIIRKMMIDSLDIARFNFSHGTHKEHLSRIKIIRGLNQKYRRHIKILQDLEGYRIRIGELPSPLTLQKKQVYYLSSKINPVRNSVSNRVKGKNRVIPFDYSGRLSDIKEGSFIYIDDGKILLKVISCQEKALKTRVLVGGILYSRKGVNIPGLKFKFKGLTEKDKADLEFAFEHKPDFIAQSFVRGKVDILSLRRYLGNRLPECKIIAKIENGDGIKNISSISEEADIIMVARGDMGVSIPVYKVPFVQKEMIKLCRKKRKKIIVATQMLESMTDNIIPTRAEVSDVANAILDGADMVMLSGETAKGKYPVESVNMMNEIIKYTENYIKIGKDYSFSSLSKR